MWQLFRNDASNGACFSGTSRGIKIFLLVLGLAAICMRLAPEFGLLRTLCIASAVGVPCVMLWYRAWFNDRNIAGRRLHIATRIIMLAALGAVFGVIVSMVASGSGWQAGLQALPRTVGIIVIGAALLVAAPLLLIGMFRSRQHALQMAALQRDAEQERLARVLSETQLRLLRAQIEPHFLFNTLGAVQQLAQESAPRAAELTAHLIAFLRASLDEMRSDTVALRDEFGLVDAYLRVMQARLGSRLRFTLSLPRALEPVRLPSMLLLTLVENAIKHGIEPALRGGEIAVSAAVHGGGVRLQVVDTGIGLGGDVVEGTGLTNARRRLELAHRGAASLALATIEAGTCAEIILPATP